jgi:hypothetical protein
MLFSSSALLLPSVTRLLPLAEEGLAVHRHPVRVTIGHVAAIGLVIGHADHRPAHARQMGQKSRKERGAGPAHA